MKITVKSDEHWDMILEPKNRLLDLKIRELIRYRDLVFMFIKRDFVTAYKQTILGPLWYIVQPLVTAVMYTFVFGNLAKIGTDGVPYLLFYFAGTMFWTYFTACLNSAAGCFSANSSIFGKVYFPRLTVPISTTVGHMIKLGIQFATLMIFYVYYLIVKAPIRPSWWIAALPLLVIWVGATGTGFGMIISALTTKYRDLNQLLGFGLSLAMYDCLSLIRSAAKVLVGVLCKPHERAHRTVPHMVLRCGKRSRIDDYDQHCRNDRVYVFWPRVV